MGKPKRNYSSTLTWQLGHWEIVPLLPFGVSQVSLAFPKIYKSSLFKRTDWKMTFPFLGNALSSRTIVDVEPQNGFHHFSSTGKLEALFRSIFMGFSYVTMISKV